MVAAGHGIDACGEEVLADLFGDPEAAGGILAVGDHEIEPEALAQLRDPRGHRDPARAADDIATEENAHQIYSQAYSKRIASASVTIQSRRLSLRPRGTARTSWAA